jgi:glycerol kinase
MTFVLALDQGTTSSRAILFDHAGAIRGVAQQEFQQFYPQSGWVEHDAQEIWQSQLTVAREVLRQHNVAAADVAAIGIANQRETTVLWDRASGQPIHHAIVWQDRRTAAFCDQLAADGHAETVTAKTGLVIDPYFSGTKLRWLLEHVPGARAKADRGELAFGTIDSWLLWNLSGGKLHMTDVSNASRTMLLNLHTLQWDDELLGLLEIPQSVLPEVRPSSQHYGNCQTDLLGHAIPLAGSAGDQHAALFGQNCTKHSMAKNTYGTGSFMLMNVGHQPVRSQQRLLTTIACTAGEQPDFALEGSVFITGAAVQWLRDGLGIIDSSPDVETLAGSVPDSGGVYMVPAFAGLGAPHWDAYARGAIVGISRGTTAAHIARATLESIAFQVADVLDAMKADAGIPIDQLRVDGGACVNDLLMQFQADILQAPVVRPKIIETTALGAAFLAGLAVGFWADNEEIEQHWKIDRVFEPAMAADEVALRRARWNDALQRSKSWEQPK